jgi:hypothetical protein
LILFKHNKYFSFNFCAFCGKKINQERQLIEITKSEYRISKYEMVRQAHHPERADVKANINNRQSKGKIELPNSNDKNRNMTGKTSNPDVVLVIETFGFRICFEFLISNFEFPDKQKINNSKADLVLACSA